MRPWTTTEARMAQAERSRATPVRQIASELGRSGHSVYGFLRYNYVPKAHSAALKRWCPQCGARVGERCFRVRREGRSNGRRKSFHTERFPR